MAAPKPVQIGPSTTMFRTRPDYAPARHVGGSSEAQQERLALGEKWRERVSGIWRFASGARALAASVFEVTFDYSSAGGAHTAGIEFDTETSVVDYSGSGFAEARPAALISAFLHPRGSLSFSCLTPPVLFPFTPCPRSLIISQSRPT
jgi:hypothetical protein